MLRDYGVLAGVLLLAIPFAVNAQSEPSRQPNEVDWFETKSDVIRHLNKTYTECLNTPDDPQVKLGKLAFNSPRLLGGQAARMGLSCASCHRSGRDNPHFFIKQISSTPGTSDITHSFLSSEGGDGIDNPKIIPDLIAPTRFLKRDSQQFEDFLHRLIEVEFDGRKTPEPIFNAINTYLKNTDKRYCYAQNATPSTRFENDWNNYVSALALLSDSSEAPEVKQFITQSARAALETLYQNVGLEPHSRVDKQLVKLSRELEKYSKSNYDPSLLKRINRQNSKLRKAINRVLDRSAYSQKALHAFYVESESSSIPR
jgi:hypothetical protein